MRSASSDAKSRVALMRLAWDFIGTEFGSRHQQYEKFYGGASFIVKQNVYRNFDFKRATALVDTALKLPPIAEDLGTPPQRARCASSRTGPLYASVDAVCSAPAPTRPKFRHP